MLCTALAVSAADCVPSPSGLVGWWPAEGDATDLMNDHDASLADGATITASGYSGGAFQFNGTTAYAFVPDAPALNPANLTIEAWVRFDSLDSTGSGGSPAGQQYIVFKKNTRSSYHEGYSLHKNRRVDGDHFFFACSSSSGQLAEVMSSTLISTGVWYHVAAIRGPNFLQLFVNGALETQTSVGFPQNYGSRPLFFGSSGETWDHKLAGTLDEVSLYDRALSGGEVAALYAAGSAGKCKELVLLANPEGGMRYWGGSITFACSAWGIQPLAYQWQKDGIAIPGATLSSLALANLQVTNSGEYSVVVTDPYNSVTSAPANLLVKVADLSVIYSEVDTQRIAELTVTGLVGQTYGIVGTTDPAGTNWTALTNMTLTAATGVWTDIRPLSDPQFYYQVMEGPIDLPIPPVITQQPANQIAVTGADVRLNVAASGMGPLAYRWRYNGAELQGSTSILGVDTPSLLMKQASPEIIGSYDVVVSNEFGAVTSSVAAVTVYDCHPVLPGLVGWWPGDGNALDVVGTNHGILQGGATADVPGWIDRGFSFDGTNKYVEIVNAPELNPQELSVECWVRFDNLDAPGTSTYVGQQYLVFKQNTRIRDFEGYVLSKDRTHADIILWEVTSASGQLIRIDSISPVQTNEWYHLVGVRGSNYIQLYFNGILEAQTDVNFPQDYGDHPLYFGTSGQAYWDRRLNGVLDEVLLYNRALSSNEVASLYAAGAVSKCKSPQIAPVPEGGSAFWGGDFLFTSGASGANPMSIQWEKDGQPVPNATNLVLALANLQLSDAGSYVFTASNAYGMVLSPPALLNVNLADVTLLPFTPGPIGTFGLNLVGQPNQVLGIQISADLSQVDSWFGVTNLTLFGGTNSWVDPAPPIEPARFYRVVPGPIALP